MSLCCPRWMYWTDWEEDPTVSNRGKIKKAWMDGSNHQVFLTSKTVLWPNGLSLDIPQGILYWVDAYYDRIEMVYLNSSARKVGCSGECLLLVDEEPLGSLFQLDFEHEYECFGLRVVETRVVMGTSVAGNELQSNGLQ